MEKIFNGLKPVPPTFLLGEWDAGELETGHAGSKALRELRWAGKNFRSVDDGDPVMVVDEAGRRVKGEEWGGASVSRKEGGGGWVMFFSVDFLHPIVPPYPLPPQKPSFFRDRVTKWPSCARWCTAG